MRGTRPGFLELETHGWASCIESVAVLIQTVDSSPHHTGILRNLGELVSILKPTMATTVRVVEIPVVAAATTMATAVPVVEIPVVVATNVATQFQLSKSPVSKSRWKLRLEKEEDAEEEEERTTHCEC